MPALPVPRFDQFYRHSELTRLLQDYAAAAPQLVALSSIGRSFEGRDIWLLTLCNRRSGEDIDKPALWVDGNIHAAELTACTACLYWLHHLLHAYEAGDAQARQLLDTRVVYLVPRLNPDGAELALADRPRHIRSSTRPYPYDEEPIDGLTVEDVDGDGRMLSMRIPDPHGPYKKHPADPRLMTPREPGEFGGDYYRLMPEGTLKNFDGIKISTNPDIEGLDLNRNFPAYWRQEFEQKGAGPYPTSEPEVRAMVQFITAHPNIGAAVSFHTHSGVILRPMGTQSDDDMTPEDLWVYKRFSDLGAKLTGYPAISIFHEFKYHPKEIITGTQDWVYEHLGALFWTVEIWAPNKEAGITDYQWIEWYRDHPPEDDLKLLTWSDAQCAGQAHVDWYPFAHPQLGMVELGGWDKLNFWRNPPPHLREREAARFPAWLMQIGLSLPCLEVLRAEVRALGNNTWRVRFAVANSGWLPAYVCKRALERKTVRGTIFQIHLPEGTRLLAGKERVEAGHLEGHAPKTSLQAFLPSRDVTGDRAVVEWVVHGPRGTPISLTARADRAGNVSHASGRRRTGHRPGADGHGLRLHLRRAGPGWPPPARVRARGRGMTAPGHWLAVASAEHVRLGRGGGFMQVCHGKVAPLRRIRPGDRVVYYSPSTAFRGSDRLQAFTALGVVREGQPYEHDMGGDFVPFRRDVDWFEAAEAPIQPLLDRLSFSAGRHNWGWALRFGVLAIEAADMDLVAAAMGVSALA